MIETDNPAFEGDDIPEEDVPDTSMPNTSGINDTSFMTPGPGVTEETLTSTLRLGQREKIKRSKLTELYKHLSMTGNLDLVNLDRFTFTPPKNGGTVLEFFGDKNQWVLLTKQEGGFLFSGKKVKKNIWRRKSNEKFP